MSEQTADPAAVPLPPTAPPHYEGRLEICTDREVLGWAWDRNNPQAVFVSIVVDGDPVCTVVADQPRADLKAAGKREGACGYCIALPDRYRDGTVREVRAVVLHANPEVLIGRGTTRPSGTGKVSPRFKPSPMAFFPSVPPVPAARIKLETARALVGRRSWLFLADDSNRVRDQFSGRFTLPDGFLETVRRVFAARREAFARLGIPYLLFAAPSKERVCADRLPAGMVLDRPNIPLAHVRDALAHDGFEVVDLADALAEVEPAAPTFYRTDTHWNARGAHAAYAAIIERVSREVACGTPYPTNAFATRRAPDWRGDLAHKEKLVFIADDEPLIPCVLPRELFREEVEHLVDESGTVSDEAIDPSLVVSQTRATVIKANRDRALPKAIVFRDSFGSWLEPMLARNFSRTIFLWRPEIMFPIIERERPDVVIQVMIDRFFVRPPVNLF